MKLDTKLKLLTCTSIAGVLTTTMSVAAIPVIQEQRHAIVAASAAVVGTIVMVASLKQIHKIDLQMNEENTNV